MTFRISLFCLAFLFFSSCEDSTFTPKPRGFPKVDYPEKNYQQFTERYCNFGFDYPTYAKIEQSNKYFDGKPENPCWFDIVIPNFDSRIHCSYSVPGESKSFDQLRADAFNLANKHNVRASAIEEFTIKTPNNVEGIAFNFEGPSASPFQFFLTDSTHQHFLRGSLYFNTQVRPDSLAPIYDFVKQDVMQLINTFEWEK